MNTKTRLRIRYSRTKTSKHFMIRAKILLFFDGSDEPASENRLRLRIR